MSAAQSPSPQLNRPYRILIAEDNPVNQKITVKLLEKMGLKADVVANGDEALQVLEIVPYDLILMDCQMPELDGYDATRRIRASSVLPNAIPIIALTANAIRGDRERCLQAGMNDYVSKPIDEKEFVRVLERWLPREGKRTESRVDGLFERRGPSGPIDLDAVSALRELEDGDTGFFRDMVEIFVQTTSEKLGEMQADFASASFKTLREGAHKLKSSSASLGAMRLAQICATIEELVLDEKHQDLPAWMEALVPEFKAAEEELRRILDPES